MISIILIFLAAACNAAMDILSHHYYLSIFETYKKPKYWNPEISWKNKYNGGDPAYGRKKWFYGMFKIHVAFTDAWHLLKSLMIVLLISAIPFCPENELGTKNWIYYSAVIIASGTVWNLTFNLFYKHLLRK